MKDILRVRYAVIKLISFFVDYNLNEKRLYTYFNINLLNTIFKRC